MIVLLHEARHFVLEAGGGGVLGGDYFRKWRGSKPTIPGRETMLGTREEASWLASTAVTGGIRVAGYVRCDVVWSSEVTCEGG